jgi:DNA polymerase II small subunit/DNA polymerase delta subunit B
MMTIRTPISSRREESADRPRDMDYISWKRDIDEDLDNLSVLICMVKTLLPEYDYKLNQLIEVIRKKEENPINPGNRKVLIFHGVC